MGTAMIRVDEGTRDILARLAERQHRPIGGVVAELAERELMAQEFHAGYERLMADPTAWAAYTRERDEWTSADLADLPGSAADEYPEYQ